MNSNEIALEGGHNLGKKRFQFFLRNVFKRGLIESDFKGCRMEPVNHKSTASRKIQERIVTHRLSNHIPGIKPYYGKSFANIRHGIAGVQIGLFNSLRQNFVRGQLP
jgi:hypothetical protein